MGAPGFKIILANDELTDLQFYLSSMKSLSHIIDRYAAFEADVGTYAAKIYLNYCSGCKGACCKPEYCAESTTSPFLNRLRQHFVPDAIYDSARGWLTETGCALPVGRPPVCHQYLCDTILRLRPAADFRYALIILSNLVNHVGKKARGHKHIVELQKSSELQRINFPRIEKQLSEAENAFRLVRVYLDGHVAKLDSFPMLEKICRPPADFSVREFC